MPDFKVEVIVAIEHPFEQAAQLKAGESFELSHQSVHGVAQYRLTATEKGISLERLNADHQISRRRERKQRVRVPGTEESPHVPGRLENEGAGSAGSHVRTMEDAP